MPGASDVSGPPTTVTPGIESLTRTFVSVTFPVLVTVNV